MLKKRTDLINGRGLDPEAVNCDSPLISADNEFFLEAMQPAHTLPANPPFEKHPYLGLVQLMDYEKYIVGTFPPVSYVADLLGVPEINQPTGDIISRPWIPFFHGNRGRMWLYLLTHQEYLQLLEIVPLAANGDPARTQAHDFLIAFLQENNINYSDIINACQRELRNNAYTSEDKRLWNICIYDRLVRQLLLNSNARVVLFNTASLFKESGLKIHRHETIHGLPGQIDIVTATSSFDLFLRACQELGLKAELRILQGPTLHFDWTEVNVENRVFLQHHMRNKLICEGRLSSRSESANSLPGFKSKDLTFITPLSPAAVNRGRARGNRVIQNWALLNHPGAPIDHGMLGGFLRFVYQSFRNGAFQELYAYNC